MDAFSCLALALVEIYIIPFFYSNSIEEFTFLYIFASFTVEISILAKVPVNFRVIYGRNFDFAQNTRKSVAKIALIYGRNSNLKQSTRKS